VYLILIYARARKSTTLINIPGKYLRYFIKKSFGPKAQELSCFADVSDAEKSLYSGIDKLELFIF